MGNRKRLRNEDGSIKQDISERKLYNDIRLLPTLKERAFVAFVYVTGARVSEVVRHYKEKNLNRKVTKTIQDEDGYLKKITENSPITERKLVGEPIIKEQIFFENNFMIVKNVRSLKRRSKTMIRTIPILLDKEDKFIQIVKDYINTLDEKDPLFDFTRVTGWRIMNKIGLYTHHLRHMRATKLAEIYDFDSFQLQQFFNWSTSKPGDTYVHLTAKALKNKMLKIKEVEQNELDKTIRQGVHKKMESDK